MGANLWRSSILAITILWSIRLCNRITRLLARSLGSFAVLALTMHRHQALVLRHIRPSRLADTSAAFQPLLLQLEQLDQVTQVAQNRPWDRAALVTLIKVSAAASAQSSVLQSGPVDLAGVALPDSLTRDWNVNSRARHRVVRGFIQMMAEDSDATVQSLAVVVTSFLGFKPASQMATPYDA